MMPIYIVYFMLPCVIFYNIEAEALWAFTDILSAGTPVLFIGDGAEKCREVLGSHPNAVFAQGCPKAAAMAAPATAAYNEKRFEDVAYFEPFYLKDFIATVSRKNLF